MKILQTNYNGGMPFELDDLRWLAEGLIEAIKGLASFIGSSCIVSGCQISSGSISDGWVLLEGELCYAPASSFSAGAVYRKITYFDSHGDDVFQDNSTHQTYQITEAQIVYPATPLPTDLLINDSNRAENLLIRKNIVSEISTITHLNPLWAIWTSTPSSVALLVSKKLGTVAMRGQLRGSGTGILFKMDFPPKTQGCSFLCPYGDNGIAKIDIDSTGQVWIVSYPIPPSTGDVLDLTGITFVTE